MKQFTKQGRLSLILGGARENAAKGKRLENGMPVLHAEFFTASISETDDTGVRHAYDFGIDTQLAELLANSNSYNQYKVVLEPRSIIKDGHIVEDIYEVPGKPTKHHKCTLVDYEVVTEKPMPANWKWVTCLDDAKAAPSEEEETQPSAPVGTAPRV